MMKFNSLPKEDQAKEIRSLMRLFSKIETIIDLDEDDIVENFNTDVACTAEMILAHQKNIRKQIKHFTKLFNEEVTPLMSKLDYEDYLKEQNDFLKFCNSVKDMSNEVCQAKLFVWTRS